MLKNTTNLRQKNHEKIPTIDNPLDWVASDNSGNW